MDICVQSLFLNTVSHSWGLIILKRARHIKFVSLVPQILCETFFGLLNQEEKVFIKLTFKLIHIFNCTVIPRLTIIIGSTKAIVN
jgi:hypothetical protein